MIFKVESDFLFLFYCRLFMSTVVKFAFKYSSIVF